MPSPLKKEIYDMIIRISIACITWLILIFYKVETIEKPTTTNNNSQYNQNHYISPETSIPETGIIEEKDMEKWSEILRKKIIIDKERWYDKQEIIIEKTISIIQNIDSTLSEKSNITNTIKKIIINKYQKNSRWYSSHDVVTINYGEMSITEFEQVLVHEIGHIIDLWLLQGYSAVKNNKFTEFELSVFGEDDPSLEYYSLSRESESTRKIWSKKQDFCSIYGMTNPFEDFAECLQLYIHHNNYFIEITKRNSVLEEKYRFINKIFNRKNAENKFPLPKKVNNNYRYRDTTRML